MRMGQEKASVQLVNVAKELKAQYYLENITTLGAKALIFHSPAIWVQFSLKAPHPNLYFFSKHEVK